MLANPLHLRLLDTCSIEILDDVFNSIDGDLVGVVGDSWVLKPDPVSITWYSIRGVEQELYPKIVEALVRDVEGLYSSSIETTSSYFYGKLVARAARFALIAEEVGYFDVIPKVFERNCRAVAGWNIDPVWGRKYRGHAYSLMADFMTLGKGYNSKNTRFRCFDLWKLHSWAGGLTEFADGRNQESTSEAVNVYYSAALLELAYGDAHLVAVGSLLTSLEIHASQTWWHVKEGDTIYAKDFTNENRVVGVLWANKRHSGLWFAPAEWRECRLGIQVLPLLPVTEVLFSDVEFVRQLVKWTLPVLAREGVGEGWKRFVYALEGVYEKDVSLEQIRSLSGYDDGNSLSNLLWWIFSRGDGGGGGTDGHSWLLSLKVRPFWSLYWLLTYCCH
ncbi:hypothetical protein L1987_74925 [Smallanthus sonchifolius]|uniref:Uncharacterized protein n=1 Tax=Smallanthus sonchifolius TaxID=185202 RepID=A0ACB9A4A1_9ASTR|nr:hypothetical protein L1987_74925 [Smallanthus sonchifolius]